MCTPEVEAPIIHLQTYQCWTSLAQIVNAATSVLLADITSGLIGVCASTFLIVIFGEVMPQKYAVTSLCMATPVLWQKASHFSTSCRICADYSTECVYQTWPQDWRPFDPACEAVSVSDNQDAILVTKTPELSHTMCDVASFDKQASEFCITRRFLLFPVAWPISRLLDRVLGRDIGTVYSQKVKGTPLQ